MKQFLYGLAICFIATLTPYAASSQTYSVTGTLLDDKDNSSLIEVDVVLTTTKDSTAKLGAVTDVNGAFSIANVPSGRYILKAVYVGYRTVTQNVTVTNSNVNIGTLKMKSGANELNSVTIKSTQIRATQLGDTTQFNANAFKTHPDATAEDLVTKMPGVTSDANGVKVNGETVQQVYVDGKPFFGTDPTLALRNLPSEVIDKIQVFDKLSDQSQFTGFDDGNAQKTINIVTKKSKSNGEFGKVYGGYGTNDRYAAGGSLNYFNGDRRISLIELSNNVNQQNFSSQDILGVTGGSGSNRGGNGGRGNNGNSGGGSSSNNFLVGQQGGITTTHSAGINYSDMWGKKIKISASYFFNSTDNVTNTQLSRYYPTSKIDSTYTYHEKDYSETKNINHRLNVRFEYAIDSFNALTITPAVSFQQNNATTSQQDTNIQANTLSDITNKSLANNNNSANYNGYSFTNNILFQHKFKKTRRTISINLGTALNEKSGTGTYYSLSDFYAGDSLLSSTLYDQYYTLYNNAFTQSVNLSYTEPVGKKGQVQLSYSPSYTKSIANKETFNKNPVTDSYTLLNDTLSNKYSNTYITQRAGVNYRVGDKNLNFSFGANYQSALLDGRQTFPHPFTINKKFDDILPQAFFNYHFEDGRNLRIMYRTNTVAPSVSQMQNVVDVSNPLLLKTGNPDLKQDYEQTVTLRYGLTKGKSAHTFFVFFSANYINNYIANASYIPSSDSSVYGIKLNRGSQLTAPINLNGYNSDRLFATYGIPADFIKSNINLNGGISYTRNPGKINSALNLSNNTAPTAGVVVSSNISENVDFTFSYTGNYNFVQNSLQTGINNNYYNHILSFKINIVFLKGIVFNTNITQNYYSTLTNTSGNENYVLWNAYLGYKFLKNKALEARISAYDLLNQNKSVTRTVSDTYVENSTTQVLQQYFMFNVTYTVRHFKGALPEQNKNNRPDDGGGHFHGDGPPPGGGQGGTGGGPGSPAPGGGGF
jgi:uncharacterized membrane protein YgcG